MFLLTQRLPVIRPICSGCFQKISGCRIRGFHLFDEPKRRLPNINPFVDLEKAFCYLIIRYKFDSNFNPFTFFQGTNQTFGVVSQALYNKDYETLGLLIDPSFLPRLQERLEQLSPAEMETLNLEAKHIGLKFHTKTKLFSSKLTDGSWETYVKMLVVYHCSRNITAKRNEDRKYPLITANFVIKRILSPVLGNWIITELNYWDHFPR